MGSWRRRSEEIADIDDWMNIEGGGRVVEEEKEERYRLGGRNIDYLKSGRKMAGIKETEKNKW